MSAVLRAIVAAGHASKVNNSLTSLRDVARDLDLHPTAKRTRVQKPERN